MLCIGYTVFISLSFQSDALARELEEYKVKAAFVYNFMVFTRWPEYSGETLNLCIFGTDYFKNEIDKLQNRSIGDHQINIVRTHNFAELEDCQTVFFSRSAQEEFAAVLEVLRTKHILTLADHPEALDHGVVINMVLSQDKVVFEINLREARKSGLNLNAKLLNLAVKVVQ